MTTFVISSFVRPVSMSREAGPMRTIAVVRPTASDAEDQACERVRGELGHHQPHAVRGDARRAGLQPRAAEVAQTADEVVVIARGRSVA